MASTLPINFPLSSESAIASYSYTDIADGTGKIDYYATRASSGATVSYVLIEDVRACGKTNTLSVGYADVNNEIYNSGNGQNFDLKAFNTSRTIKGTAVISGTCYRKSANVSFSFQFAKWDGSSETTFSSAISTDTLTADKTINFLIPISLTETNFKRGDVLRLKIKSSTGSGSSAIGIDPTGASVGIDFQVLNPLIVSVPFKIDL